MIEYEDIDHCRDCDGIECCGGFNLEPHTDCTHSWSSEGEGGCSENPGVWSLGGTTIHTSEHCAHCGLRRKVTMYGSQRNPGQCDSVTYEVKEEYK
jgi:hypothetical protein